MWNSEVPGYKANPNVEGLITGTKTKVLGENKWLSDVYRYNDRYQCIQTVHETYTGDQDATLNYYNFRGQLALSRVGANTGTVSYTTLKWYNYNAAGKLNNIAMQMEGDAKRTIASYTYDDFGRLKTKSIHNGAETATYKYDISGRKIGETSPLFSYDVWFDKAAPGQTARHDGNMGQVTWGYNATGNQNGYVLSYDNYGQMASRINSPPPATTG